MLVFSFEHEILCNGRTLKKFYYEIITTQGKKKLCKGVLYPPKTTLPLTFTPIYMPSHNIMPFIALMAPHSTTQSSSCKGH